MKNNILILLTLIFGLQLYSQTTKSFTKQFTTSSGIYGYAEILTRPATYGFASIKIQATKIIIEGIRSSQGNFSGNDLSEYGVSFPLNCNNCYFLAEGQAKMYLDALQGGYNGYTAEAPFNTSGSVHLNRYTSHTATFNENAVNRHNSLRKEKGFSVWEKSGYVSYIKISRIEGGDLGIVTRAVTKYENAKKQKELKTNQSQNNNSGIVLQEQTNNNSSSTNYNKSTKEDDDVNESKNTNSNYNSYSLPKREQTFSQKMDNVVLSSNNMSSDQKSAYREYMVKRNKTEAESNARYQKQAAQTQLYTDLAVGAINYFTQRAAENRRWQAEQKAKKRAEEARKRDFKNEAGNFRYEIKTIINNRKELFTEAKVKTTYDLDGTGFKPIYIYYAYTKKGYDYFYENVKYPNTMEFKMQETARIYFSPVFGVFPNSNGTYPFISDIKKQIIDEHFLYNANNYDIHFFNRETSIDWLIQSLKDNLNNSVNKYGFTNAIPSTNNSIVFLNNKMTANNSKDYWTGDKVKKKTTKKVDYFKDDKKEKTTKKKVDYWDTAKTTKTKKKTTKKKNPNYWDN